MVQSVVFWYFVLVCLYVLTFHAVTDFNSFFFFTECVWLSIFMVILGSNLTLGNPVLLANTFFVLVFTACEAVVFSGVLLLLLEDNPTDTFFSPTSD